MFDKKFLKRKQPI